MSETSTMEKEINKENLMDEKTNEPAVRERKESGQEQMNEEIEDVIVVTKHRNSTQASEVKASGIALLVLGIIGLVITVLYILDKFPIHYTLSSRIIIGTAMGILFVCMLVFGIISMRSVKVFAGMAKEEDRLTEEIIRWYRQNLSADMIDSDLFDEGGKAMPEEMKYFRRYAKIKFLLNQKFMNLDPAYSEEMVEEIYQYIYEN
ncbi:MAG: hypothetical protein ACI4DU_04585 [Lachnospiraceae bacterium]